MALGQELSQSQPDPFECWWQDRMNTKKQVQTRVIERARQAGTLGEGWPEDHVRTQHRSAREQELFDEVTESMKQLDYIRKKNHGHLN